MIHIYACEDCGFLFQRANEVDECPGCDRRRIRPATEKEAQQLMQTLSGETKAPSHREKCKADTK